MKKYKIKKLFFLLVCFICMLILVMMIIVTIRKNEQLFLKYINICDINLKSITILYNTEKYDLEKGTAKYDDFYLLICDLLKLLKDESFEFQRGMLTAGIYVILYDIEGFYLELGIGYSKQQSKVIVQILDTHRNSIMKYYNVNAVDVDFIFSRYNLLIKNYMMKEKKLG